MTMMLDANAFSTYNVSKKAFVLNPGDYKIKVGASSRDIRQTFPIKVGRPARPTTASN